MSPAIEDAFGKFIALVACLIGLSLFPGGHCWAATPVVAAGGSGGYKAGFGCALDVDGVLACWGDDRYGQLGQGRLLQSATPLRVGDGYMPVPRQAGQAVIAANREYAVAIKSDGSLWTWGANDFGQLGDGTRVDRSTPTQIGTGFTSVAAGNSSVVALKSDGSMWAWGNNNAGQVGDGTTIPSLTPKQIGTGFISVAGGQDHFAAIKSDGSLWTWGSNMSGELGDGTTTDSTTPKQIDTGFVSVAAGGAHTFAIKSDHSLWAWGANFMGQLGD